MLAMSVPREATSLTALLSVHWSAVLLSTENRDSVPIKICKMALRRSITGLLDPSPLNAAVNLICLAGGAPIRLYLPFSAFSIHAKIEF